MKIMFLNSVFRNYLVVGLSASLLLIGCSSGEKVETAAPSPTPETTSTTSAVDSDLKPALQQAIAQFMQAEKVPADSKQTFLADYIDLNDDGALDAVVLLTGSDWCGSGGCTMLVFQGKDKTFNLISSSTLVRSPLTVGETKTNGWRDLIVEVSGGGATPAQVALKFDGTAYPKNPSVEPALPQNSSIKGTVIFPEGTSPQTLSKVGSDTPSKTGLQIYDDPVMAIATKYPNTMAIESNCSGEGCGYFFKFKPQNTGLDQSEVHIFLSAGARTAADSEKSANGLIQSNGWQVTAAATPPQDLSYPWVKKVIAFSAEKGMMGYILIGETNRQGIQITLRYPTELSATFMPAAKTILDNLQFKPDKLPITTQG